MDGDGAIRCVFGGSATLLLWGAREGGCRAKPDTAAGNTMSTTIPSILIILSCPGESAASGCLFPLPAVVLGSKAYVV